MKESAWHSYRYQLNYRLGEITLFDVEIPVLRKVHRLSEIRLPSGFPVLPPLGSAEQGYLVASLPEPSAAGELRRDDAFLRYCVKSYPHSYIDLAQDFSAYQAKFSSKTRSTINRKLRKFIESAGGEDFRRYARGNDMAEFLRHARAVSAGSYQERLLNSGLPADATFAAQLEAAANRDEVRAFLLFHRGAPVSYLYCPVDNNVLLYSHLGYLPEVAHLSAGTVLQWLALRSLFEEGRFQAFDFTEGDSEQKRFFGTHQTPCSHYLLLRMNWRNWLLLHSHQALERFSAWLGAFLDRLGLKTHVRRWIRRNA